MGSYGYFKGALAFARANYQEAIDRISNTKFDEISPTSFFDEYVWAVYVSGFRASTISKIWDRLMGNYRWLCISSQRPNQPSDLFDIKQKAMAIFANERKVDAVIKGAGIIWNGVKEMGWQAWKEQNLSTPEKLQTLPFIGKITCYHLARNIGLLQYVKPDVHLERMAKHWQYESPQKMCEHLGELHGLQPGIVDLVLWYAASTFGTRNNKETRQ
jgi:hypothetical protein